MTTLKITNYRAIRSAEIDINPVALITGNNGAGKSSLLDAINRGGDRDILFVAAAGNGGIDGVGDNNDTTANYPSNYRCTSNNNSGCACRCLRRSMTS